MCDSESGCACSTAETTAPAVNAAGVQAVYSITGMTCGGCAARVRNGISEVPGVGDVSVDVQAGTVTVTSDADIDDATIDAAVTKAGYQLVR
jgi:copper chaperone CopZ